MTDMPIAPGHDFSEADKLYGALEAILMIIDEPASVQTLARALSVPVPTVSQALGDLAAQYLGQGGSRPHGFVLRQVGGGWRIYSHPDFAPILEAFVVAGQSGRLTQAALETLAVIAYQQPCSRAQVAGVRGVNVDSVVRNLAARGLIEEVGVGASGATLYGTTADFLAQLGLNSLEELPPLAPYLPSARDLGDLVSGLEEGRK